jgi:hypothetical protein
MYITVTEQNKYIQGCFRQWLLLTTMLKSLPFAHMALGVVELSGADF